LWVITRWKSAYKWLPMCYNVVHIHLHSITLKRVNIFRKYKEKEGYQAQLSSFSFVPYHIPIVVV